MKKLLEKMCMMKWLKITEHQKITDHDHNNKCFTTQKFNTLPAEIFVARLKQANLATKAYIDDFVEKTDFDDKFKSYIKKILKQNRTYSG